MDAFRKMLQRFGVARIAIGASVLLAFVGIMIIATSHITKQKMSLLCSQVDLAEAAQIVERLEQMGVPVEVKGDGSQIYVPSDRVLRLRMTLAEAGLPSAGSAVGYEIFDRSDVLGTTSFIQDHNYIRALEGELSRTIRSIRHVAGARVHIVIPKRELFSKEKVKPTASILLKMQGNASLSTSQVQSIQHLVASAVPNLCADQISILDHRGTLLARGEDTEGSAGQSLLRAEEARQTYEMRTSRMLEALLGRSVGAGKVRAEVSVTLDTDRLTEQSEDYDPDKQVVRSTQTSVDMETNQDSATPITVTNNLPNTQSNFAPTGGAQRSGKKSTETINYEISKKITTRVKGWGGIKTLSVAVMVDGLYTTQDNGNTVYAPRSAEEISELKKLVQTAVGFSQERGDTVEVVNMRFAEDSISDPAEPARIMGWDHQELLKVIQNITLAIIGLLVLVFVVRPIAQRLLNPTAPESTIALASGNTSSIASLGDTTESRDLTQKVSDASLSQDDDDQTVFKESIVGEMRLSLLKRVESLIDQHPEDAASILRTWMKHH